MTSPAARFSRTKLARANAARQHEQLMRMRKDKPVPERS